MSMQRFAFSSVAILQIRRLVTEGVRKSRRGPRFYTREVSWAIEALRGTVPGEPPSMREIINELVSGGYVDRPPSPPTIQRAIVRLARQAP